MHDGDDDPDPRTCQTTDLAPPLHLAGIDDDELPEPHLVRGID